MISGFNMKDVRMIYGVGINDSDYVVETCTVVDGKRIRKICPYYSRWKNMLKRCYHNKSKFHTYESTTVSKDWLIFSNFKKWMESQEWEGKQLDKDILGDGRLYSPQTCCFVDNIINCFVLESRKSRGDCPIGVHYSKRYKSYQAYCSFQNKKINLGTYKSRELAHLAWCLYKRCLLDKIISNQNPSVSLALRNKYDSLVDKAFLEVSKIG